MSMEEITYTFAKLLTGMWGGGVLACYLNGAVTIAWWHNLVFVIPQTEAYFKYGPLVIDTYTQIECEENLDMSDIYFGRQDGANILFTQTKNIKLVDKKHVNGSVTVIQENLEQFQKKTNGVY